MKHWCEECKEECEVTAVDDGIGWNDYGGNRTFHHEYIEVSSCCLGGLLPSDPLSKEDEE